MIPTTRQNATLKDVCCATWSSPIIRLLLGERLHPGGERTTALTVRCLGLQPGARILDLGCGYGSSVAMLVAQGYVAFGLDLAHHAAFPSSTSGMMVVADAEHPPVRDGSLDGIIMECVLSLLPDKRGALVRAHGALRAGGRIAISDVAIERSLPPHLQEVANWSTCVGGALSTSGYTELLEDSGFTAVESVCLDEDLIALIEQVRRRTSLMEVTLAVGGVDLGSLGLDHERLEALRNLAASGVDAIRAGEAGYRVLHATKR